MNVIIIRYFLNSLWGLFEVRNKGVPLYSYTIQHQFLERGIVAWRNLVCHLTEQIIVAQIEEIELR